ncbi:hypothetical protein QJQ45_021575 [Haematococcus lacustris]|nr:hypothetical protein QJQ45_021575 [Haematococcus lacustris]
MALTPTLHPNLRMMLLNARLPGQARPTMHGTLRQRTCICAAQPSSDTSRPPRPVRPPETLGPDGQPLQVVPVEKAGPEAWAGVAAIDRGADNFNYSKALTLAGGDAVALLLFAAAGRINHGGVLDWETGLTALPFLLGWFATAPFLGGFGPEAQGSKVPAATLVAAKCWAVATPLGLALRGLSKGYVPPTPFIIVSFVATAVLLLGWRAAAAATTKEDPSQSPVVSAASRKNKQGNPLEFLSLLKSLTTRW